MAEAKGLLLLLLLVVRVTPLCSPARFIVLCHHVVYIVIFPSHVLAISGTSTANWPRNGSAHSEIHPVRKLHACHVNCSSPQFF